MMKRYERLIAILFLIFSSGAILPMIFAEEFPVDVNTMSDYRLLLIQVLINSALLGILCMRVWNNRPFLIPPFWLGLFIVWSICSVSWAGDPMHAARRLFWDLLAMAFGFYLGSNYTNQEEVDLLFKALLFCSVLSILIAIYDPEWAYMRGGSLTGALRGVFAHKNVMGRNMLLLGMACIYRLRASQNARRGWIFVILALALLLLIMSRSATSLILFVLALALLPLLWFFRLPPMKIALGGFIALLALAASTAVLALNRTAILSLLGKKADLSGRTELWSQVIVAIGRHPWHGYGVYTFWMGMYGPSASVIEAVGWDVPHAHNGFLDLLLDVGMVGLLLFVFVYLSALRGSIRNYRNGQGETELWPLLFLSIFFFANLTESSIIHQSLFWILFISSAYRASHKVQPQPSALAAGVQVKRTPRRRFNTLGRAVHEL